MRRKVVLLSGILVFLVAAQSMADEPLLAELYGSGVHAFNRGDYRAAHADLTAAIQGGSNDPRAYYFRGLTYLRLGRQQEAVADFQKGAETETGDSAGVYPVSRSLERVQGRPRQQLERYRSAARLTAHQRQESTRQARYQQRVAAEREVLRKVQPTELIPAPSDAATSPPSATEAAAEPDESDDPFAAPMPTPSERGRPSQPMPEEAEEESPFAPMPAPAESDPFESPRAPMPESPPSPAEDDDPFGGGNPERAPSEPTTPMAEDDSFEDPPPLPTPRPAPNEQPSPAPAEDSDPFGGAPEPTPNPPPATPPPVDTPRDPAAAGGDANATVKPTPGGVGGLFKSLVKATPGGSAAEAGVTGEAPSGGLLSNLSRFELPLPGFGGSPPANNEPMPLPGAAPAGAASSDDDPFGDLPDSNVMEVEEEEIKEVKVEEEKEMSDDPFGDLPSDPAAPPAPAPMPADDTDDPFGALPSETPPTPPSTEPASPPAAADDDPFAN